MSGTWDAGMKMCGWRSENSHSPVKPQVLGHDIGGSKVAGKKEEKSGAQGPGSHSLGNMLGTGSQSCGS